MKHRKNIGSNKDSNVEVLLMGGVSCGRALYARVGVCVCVCCVYVEREWAPAWKMREGEESAP